MRCTALRMGGGMIFMNTWTGGGRGSGGPASHTRTFPDLVPPPRESSTENHLEKFGLNPLHYVNATLYTKLGVRRGEFPFIADQPHCHQVCDLWKIKGLNEKQCSKSRLSRAWPSTDIKSYIFDHLTKVRPAKNVDSHRKKCTKIILPKKSWNIFLWQLCQGMLLYGGELGRHVFNGYIAHLDK